VLLTNPGGPGGSGVDLVRHADDVFGASVRDRFDIVSWDPRGVGAGTSVDCGDKLDYFYAVDRSNADASTMRKNVVAAKRLAAGCRRNSHGLLPFLSTRASVADMDAIRVAITAFHDLTTSLAHETLPARVGGEQRTLGPGEANIGIATALYAGRGRSGWERLGNALRDAAQGDGSGLLALSDLYTGRQPGGRYDDETDAFYEIGCLDAPAPPTAAAVRRIAARAERVAPVFGASNAWLGLPCTFWPAKPDGNAGPIHAAGAPPILVIGTTDDPATPYASARALSRQLQSGRLLTYVGEGHTAYGRDDSCIDDKVDAYLISLRLPRVGTRCT